MIHTFSFQLLYVVLLSVLCNNCNKIIKYLQCQASSYICKVIQMKIFYIQIFQSFLLGHSCLFQFVCKFDMPRPMLQVPMGAVQNLQGPFSTRVSTNNSNISTSHISFVLCSEAFLHSQWSLITYYTFLGHYVIEFSEVAEKEPIIEIIIDINGL